MTFVVHSIEDAPQEAQATLERIRKDKGFLPNLMGVLAEAPATLEAYLALEKFWEDTSFSQEERDVVFLTVSYYHGSNYCMSAHSKEATEDNLPQDVIEALREGEEIEDEKLEALRLYTVGVLKHHGRPSDDDINRFLDAGYGPQQALEIVLGIAMKTITNYTNSLAHTPLDEKFKDTAWTHRRAA